MAATWIIKTKGEPAGPFDLKQMRALADAGRLRRDDQVQRVGSDDWRDAGRVIAFWNVTNSALKNYMERNFRADALPAEGPLPATTSAGAASPRSPGSPQSRTSSHPGQLQGDGQRHEELPPPPVMTDDHAAPDHRKKQAKAKRVNKRGSINKLLLRGGLVFGPLAGHLLYELRVNVARTQGEIDTTSTGGEFDYNYFSFMHWEYLFFGLLGGVILGGGIALILRMLDDPKKSN